MVDDIERDLSTVLDERAGQPHADVSDALAEHTRRMAARGRAVRIRSVAGVAAAVALIALGGAVVLNQPASRSRPAVTAAHSTQPRPAARPDVNVALKLADFSALGKQWTAYVKKIGRASCRERV